PIQNMVLSPTSTSYLRAKVSLPSSPMRNTDRPAGTVLIASPSRTASGALCSATSRRPLGSMWKVRGWIFCVSMCWIGDGSPVDWFIAYTTMLFSPPLKTCLPCNSAVASARLAPYQKAAVRVEVKGAVRLSGPDIFRLGQCFGAEGDLRVDPAALHRIGVHFVLRFDRHVHPGFGRVKVEVPRAELLPAIGRDRYL